MIRAFGVFLAAAILTSVPPGASAAPADLAPIILPPPAAPGERCLIDAFGAAQIRFAVPNLMVQLASASAG